MTNPTTGLPADKLKADGTTSVRDVDDEHRGVHVEHHRRRAARDHQPAEAVTRLDRTLRLARDDGAPPARRPVLQLVRPQHAPKIAAWPPTGADADLSSVDNGWLATGLHVVRERAGGRRARPSTTRWTWACSTAWTSGVYYRPDTSTASRSISRPSTGNNPVLLRHDGEREPDRHLHRHRQGRAAGQGRTSDRGGRSPTRVTGAGRRRSRSASTDLPRGATNGRHRLRGRLPVRRTTGSSRAGAAACSRR